MKSLLKDLEKNILHPIYRLNGDDILQQKNALNLIENACEISMPELNIDIFDDDNFDAEKIILSCTQIPMMSKKRLVIVKNILKAKESEIKKLTAYANAPSIDTVLVFVEIIGLNLFAKIPSQKVMCKKLSTAELVKIITDELAKLNIKISENNATLLTEFCSNDELRIHNEISKLAFVGASEITQKIIETNVKKNDDFSIFQISASLTKGEGNKSIILIKKMLESMEFPIILGLISSYFRRAMYAYMSEGTNAEIAKNLGVQEYAISQVKNSCKDISLKQILKINELILNIDFDIKSGKFTSENAMYFLVFRILEIIKEGK